MDAGSESSEGRSIIMGKRREQLIFMRSFLTERAIMRYGAHLRRDPLCRLHLEPGRMDPYGLYEEVRRRGPLSRSTAGPWVSATHAVCHDVLRDRRFGAAAEEDRPGPTPQLSFLEMNPPDHTRLRRFVTASFSPRAVAAFAEPIQAVVDDLLDAIPPGAPFDLVGQLASPMPIATITRLLGIPEADAEEFAHYGTVFGSALGGLQSIRHAGELIRAQRALEQIFVRQFARRGVADRDDVIGRLVGAAADGTVRPEEVVPLCTLLLIAGFETTVNLIGNTVLALLRNPEAWRRVVADPELTEAAVEETLRWDSPVQRTARIALSDLELAGRTIAKGQLVITLLGGANRDPLVFERPEAFDLDRSNRHEHLAFSGGIHYCIGAPLARLEAVIAVRTLLTRFPELRMAGPLVRRPGTLIRGLSRFQVIGSPSRVGHPSQEGGVKR